MTTLMRNGRDRRSENPMCHAKKERAELIGTDQWITSGPAATTAASRGRIHGCTRIVSRKVRFFSLAPRAPSIHGTKREYLLGLPMALSSEQRTQDRGTLRVSKVENDESRGGISPARAPRTVREPLDSYGSRCSAVA